MSTKLEISLISYNVGSGVRDYHQVCSHNDPEIKNQQYDTWGRQPKIQDEYTNKQNDIAKKLLAGADVLLLQEVCVETGLDRPLLKTLEKTHEFFFTGSKQNKPDCLIALKKNDFTIENVSQNIDMKDTAMVVATHIVSGKRILFVSAHVPGFKFENLSTQTEISETGDNYCKLLVKKIQKLCETLLVDSIVVGADMNANPEQMSTIKNNRFSCFDSAGFQNNRTNMYTNVNPSSDAFPQRELDFILTKNVEATPITASGDWKTNPSDHLPIVANISLTEMPEECNTIDRLKCQGIEANISLTEMPEECNTIDRLKCLGLAVATPIVQTVLTVYDIAWRFLRLVALGHFWDRKSKESFHECAIEYVQDAGKLLLKIVAAPIALIGLEFAAIYGMVDVDNGKQLYIGIEKALDNFLGVGQPMFT